MAEFNYVFEYPAHLKELYALADKRPLYDQLREIALDHSSNAIQYFVDCISLYHHELPDGINLNVLKSMVIEIINNSFDVVNKAKLQNSDIQTISIDLSIQLEANTIRIKFRDNGPGFDKIQTARKMPLTDYLYRRTSHSIFSLFRLNKKPVASISSDKIKEKQLGMNFIMGGYGVGLAEMDNIIKQAKGTIMIKNRSRHGASIEICLPRTGLTPALSQEERVGRMREYGARCDQDILPAVDYVMPDIENIIMSEPLLSTRSTCKNYGTC